ncbi:hypothetical protein D9611_000458 [Ephemerocybe angulata]|uniref:Short-chain dehydrogenase n=2 Tax=Ephemerocybe angulata TaxID=980116 RepID=A0A8H6ICU4_9AGAR|nr:hypothetical protein D9611_000458 [Tulosesus angulatus]KAF6763196.1 short-chain dehydrogenase [Tulosesus angulatus]
MKLGLLTFFSEQWRKIPPVATADLTGQTVVVVGANTGLGFEASKHFARMNPGKLVLACRNEAKGKAALAKLKAETGCNTAELRLVDLANFSSVVGFADSFEKTGERLDILVANAGMESDQYRQTPDGWEEVLQVNVLSTALLCLLLAPRLADTGKKHGTRPRLTIVGSGVHYWRDIPERVYGAPSPFEYLNSKEYCHSKGYMANYRYFETKVLSVFFTHSLADLLKDTPVVVDTVNPGYCLSEFRRNYSGFRAFVDFCMEKLLAWTTEEGSRQIVFAAVGKYSNPDELHGAFINLHEVVEASDHVIGDDGKRRRDILWTDLIHELTKVEGRVREIVREYSTQ